MHMKTISLKTYCITRVNVLLISSYIYFGIIVRKPFLIRLRRHYVFMHENEISMHENEISMHENEISMHENENLSPRIFLSPPNMGCIHPNAWIFNLLKCKGKLSFSCKDILFSCMKISFLSMEFSFSCM